MELLPDVSKEQRAGRAVEAETPGAAETRGPDLGARAGHSHKGIVRRDAIRKGGDVDAEDFPEEGVHVLRILERVAAASPVAGGEVQHAVRPEGAEPPVMFRSPVGNAEDDALARARDVASWRGREPLDRDVALEIHVVDEEASVAGVLWMECHAEHSPLPGEIHARSDVEEWLREQCVVGENANAA